MAKVAQIIFITGVGINIYLSYKNSKDKKEFYEKQLKIFKLLSLASLSQSFRILYLEIDM